MRSCRGDIDDVAALLPAHDRKGMLDGEHHGFQVDGHDPVESLTLDLADLGIAAGNRNADIVVQDIEPPPAITGVRDHRGNVGLVGDIRTERDGVAPLGGNLCHRGGGGIQIAVGDQNTRPGPGIGDGGGTAVADCLPSRLAATDDNRRLPVKAQNALRNFAAILCHHASPPAVPAFMTYRIAVVSAAVQPRMTGDTTYGAWPRGVSRSDNAVTRPITAATSTSVKAVRQSPSALMPCPVDEPAVPLKVQRQPDKGLQDRAGRHSHGVHNTR